VIREYVAVDLETTGRSVEDGHRVIQIGVALSNGFDWKSDIGWTDNYPWQQEALNVNGFTHDRIRKGPAAEHVDTSLSLWLADRGFKYNSLRAVGWNVGSFDLPFIAKYLPMTREYFDFRAADLNTACFLLSFAGYGPSETLKSQSKKYAEAKLRKTGAAPEWHDALYDAKAALQSFQYLINVAKKPMGLTA
jgi:DNA polymerase III epsilon subunit-like protein